MRGALLLGLGFGLLVLQTALATLIPMHRFAPNPLLPIAIYLGVSAESPVVRGALLSFILGYLFDSFCGNPMGLQTFVLVASFLVARGAGQRLMPQGVAFQVLSTFLMAVLSGATVVALRAIFEEQSGLRTLDDPVESGMTLVRTALTTAAISPVVFALTRRIEAAPKTEERIAAS